MMKQKTFIQGLLCFLTLVILSSLCICNVKAIGEENYPMNDFSGRNAESAGGGDSAMTPGGDVNSDSAMTPDKDSGTNSAPAPDTTKKEDEDSHRDSGDTVVGSDSESSMENSDKETKNKAVWIIVTILAVIIIVIIVIALVTKKK